MKKLLITLKFATLSYFGMSKSMYKYSTFAAAKAAPEEDYEIDWRMAFAKQHILERQELIKEAANALSIKNVNTKDINAEYNMGHTLIRGTLLHGIVRTRNLELIKRLIYYGADVNAKDRYAETPLHIAALRGYQEVANLLIEKGADVNAQDSRGSTPLHLAVCYGKLALAQLLIERGADVDAKGIFNLTPLHSAACRGYQELVQLLIDNGADVHARCRSDRTPLDKANAKGHTAVVKLLESAAKKIHSDIIAPDICKDRCELQ